MSATPTLLELIDAYAADAAALGKVDETLPGIHRAKIVGRLAEIYRLGSTGGRIQSLIGRDVLTDRDARP